MCYKKPGPRCSAWAKKRLDDLESKKISVFGDPDEYDRHQEEIRSAYLDCDATPGGQKYLRARIAQGDSDGRYVERLENGIKLRQMQLAAIKAAEEGDNFNHEVENPFHTTPDFPEDYATVRKGWGKGERGTLSPEAKEYMRASDNAMHHLSPEEQSGLWWITSSGGPFVNSRLAAKAKVSDKWTFSKTRQHRDNEYSEEFVNENQKALDSAFAKHRLVEPASLYRGLNEWSLPEELSERGLTDEQVQAKTLEYLQERYPEGEEVTIHEYMSTSADPAKGSSFTHWRNKVVLEVQTKAAIPVGRLSAWKHHEREYVVNAGGKYRVDSIQQNVPYADPYINDPDHTAEVTVVRLVEVEED